MLDLIKKAQKNIKGVVEPTPLVYSSSFSRFYGFECWLKLENLQKTGSFKARGAYNKLCSLDPEERKKGVITASSGNHAQGVAWACSLLGLKAVIVMPDTAPIVKVSATAGYGAEVIIHGRTFDESYGFALQNALDRGTVFVHPFEDDLVIAGQGTIGLEILHALPEVDTVVVPIGGGGLISGIATGIKSIKKDVSIIGVEAEASTSCILSLKAGKPVDSARRPTIADGIAIKRIGEKTFKLIKKHVDAVESVGEESVAAAILQFLERKKLIVEGAGAVTLACAIEKKLPKKVKNAVLVVSGGNIDVTTLDRIIRLGLLREGRVMRISLVIEDVPGALAALVASIAGLKANILHIDHRREAEDVPLGSTRIEAVLEVSGADHADMVLKGLRAAGYAMSR